MDRPDVSECWWQTEGDVKTNREEGSMGSYYCTREACPTNRNRCPIDSGDVSPSPSAPLPKPRSSSTKGLFVVYRQIFSQSKYSSCSRSTIPMYLFWWCLMKSSYMVTEVLVLYLVSDLPLKRSVKLVWKRRRLQYNCFHRQCQYLWRNGEKTWTLSASDSTHILPRMRLDSRSEIDNSSPMPPYS